jgi:hypothetical protein
MGEGATVVQLIHQYLEAHSDLSVVPAQEAVAGLRH